MNFSNSYRLLFFSCIFVLLQLNDAVAQINSSISHVNIAMRMIGNEILLQSGDDSSIVMPVEKINNRFKLSFENDFALNPLEIADAIHPVVTAKKLANRYRVEVEWCDSNIVVYGYEIGINDSTSLIACARRLQPLDCYNIFITLLDQHKASTFPFLETIQQSSYSSVFRSITSALIVFALVLIIGITVYVKKKPTPSEVSDHIITIGTYQFNRKNMMLTNKSSKVELTGKEADLLLLLHSDANQTIEREKILQQVWGDDGDYVGRTLDVFISKLRKKLNNDSALKIINIRGVGYKLLVDD